MFSKVLCCSLLLIVCAQLVVCQADSATPDATAQASAPVCGDIEGNSDFYGIGVRIGFYMLWLSSLIGFVFNPEELATIGDAQTVFDLANLIAIIVLTVKQSQAKHDGSKQVHVIVPILLFYMFFGGCIVSVTSTAASVQEFRTGRGMKKFSTITRQIFVQLTFLAMLGYSIAFWAKGFHDFQLIRECGVYIFPFPERLRLDGSPVIAILAIPVLIVLYVLIWWVAYKRLVHSTDGPDKKPRSSTFKHSSHKAFRNISQTGSYGRWRSIWDESRWTIMGTTFIGLSIILCIAGIESNISRNNVVGVNDILSTGQLIPFIIGLFSVPTSIWAALKNNPGPLHKFFPHRNSQHDGIEKRPMIPGQRTTMRPESYASLEVQDVHLDEFDSNNTRAPIKQTRDY